MDQKGSAAILTVRRITGIAPEVELRIAQVTKLANDWIHPGFETQGRQRQKSKRGVPVVAHKKDPCPAIQDVEVHQKRLDVRIQTFRCFEHSLGTHCIDAVMLHWINSYDIRSNELREV